MLATLIALAVIGQLESTRDLGVSLGPGVSFYSGDQRGPVRDVEASGFFVRADYVFRQRSWFAPRLYGGTLTTTPDRYSCHGGMPCDTHANVFFAGGAFRFILPIAWIAPFVEIGGGPSFGHIETRYGPAVERGRDGVFGHIDFGFGLGLGRYHQLEVGVQLLEHPEMQNAAGGVTVGLRFPL